MNCPVCNNPNAEECAHEVDIGVGIQKHVYGYECPSCGQIAVCGRCGGVGTRHAEYCHDQPEQADDFEPPF